MQTVHLLIKGNVQGVFYRASAKEKADKLGVTGWIRNTEDESVEATATGEDETIGKFIACANKV
ncbi:MAG: acylphosphatase, partial [Chitinophagaceae bacterium]